MASNRLPARVTLCAVTRQLQAGQQGGGHRHAAAQRARRRVGRDRGQKGRQRTALRLALGQDVLKSAGIQYAQTPFLKDRCVSGGDPIHGPTRQSTEAALELTSQ
jgi:hypothetical protein